METNQWVEKAKDYVMVAANVTGTATYQDTELTSAEISVLWATYMHYSMLACVFRYFEKVEADESDIRPLMSETLGLSEKRIARVAEIFNKENITIPIGFTEKDVNLEAPRLFTDSYHLYYLRNMCRVGLTMNIFNLNISTRSDIIDFYNKSIATTTDLSNKVINVMLSKGILPRHPYIPISDQRDITRRTSFLGGLIGEKRPLLGLEITHLYANALINHIGRVLLTGFAQVAKSEKVRDYLIEGTKISDSLIEDFTSILREDGIPTPLPWDAGITDSTIAPFSDKLMMFHLTLLTAAGVGVYGVSLAASPRKDLGAKYAQLIANVGSYTLKGATIMVENGWMEEPPQGYKSEEASKVH